MNEQLVLCVGQSFERLLQLFHLTNCSSVFFFQAFDDIFSTEREGDVGEGNKAEKGKGGTYAFVGSKRR